MEPTQELIDAIYADKVVRARRWPAEIKLIAGAQLFDYACSILRAGIRHQFPGADAAKVERILRLRLDLRDRLDVVTGSRGTSP